ncbi:MAG: carbon-nitrogen hydrolase family protein, partial [Candidatus Latescibacteria bacterium]|nr:carbon-nitrogen hydrolase family protein [Candidatus Latescibacterota bacterium]
CHDIRYPELVRLPAAMGAKVCFMANCESSIVHEHKLLAYRSMPISRATENGIYLVMANAPAYKDDPDCSSSSHGNSKIIEPDGNVLVEAGWFTEETVTWDLDLGEAKGHIAWRSYTDDTPLKEWLTDGMKIVEGGSPIGPE